MSLQLCGQWQQTPQALGVLWDPSQVHPGDNGVALLHEIHSGVYGNPTVSSTLKGKAFNFGFTGLWPLLIAIADACSFPKQQHIMAQALRDYTTILAFCLLVIGLGWTLQDSPKWLHSPLSPSTNSLSGRGQANHQHPKQSNS